MNELHLFSGAGGGILGGILLGHTPVCAVEIEPFPRKVLLQRQRDGILPKFPIWDDVCTFDGRPWRGLVDIVCGGFPCQDISVAGKGGGIENGVRSGLWAEQKRIICEVEPTFALMENSPMLTSRGLGILLGDLAEMGYDAWWGCFRANEAGLPHERERIFVLAANPNKANVKGDVKQALSRLPLLQGVEYNGMAAGEHELRAIFSPGLCRKHNGMADQMDRLAAVGNGQVPEVVKTAWEVLSRGIE